MRKNIVWSLVFILFLIVALACSYGCEEPEPTPTMTSTAVCQYVNQALSVGYQYARDTARYEIRYSVREAIYFPEFCYSHGQTDYGEYKDTWIVKVDVVAESQQLIDGQWVYKGIYGGNPSTQQYVETYLFDETTAKLTKKES